jgi:hypothetical protein
MLDELLPTYDKAERHHRLVAASAAATYEALKSLTMRELPLVRLLFGIRSLPALLVRGRGLPGHDEGRPMIDGFARMGFTMLKDDPGNEVVLGVIGQLWRPSGRIVRFADAAEFIAFDRPGFAKAAVTFQFRPPRSGATTDRTAVFTETRIATTCSAAGRAFARYWVLIGPFSAVIRRSWLAALARRAERS